MNNLELSKKPKGTPLVYFCGGQQSALRSTKYQAELLEADPKKVKTKIAFTNAAGERVIKTVDPENLDLLRC